MTRKPAANPFVGLRPFSTADSRVFFGRDDQVAELLGILASTRFLPLVGGSGSGKSSLVLAGLIPRLRAGFLVGTRDRWRIATSRPGDAPIANLAASLASAFEPSDPEADAKLLDGALRVGLADAAIAYIERLAPNESLLILIDQFEELFAFRGATVDDEGGLPIAERQRRAQRRSEAADYIDLLLGIAAARRDLPVFVVLTMRSDFLGDCDVFLGLPEAMNEARYLVPRLSRAQLTEAIEGPALMHGGDVSARLLDSLLNDLGDRGDRLPVLQHALQRTWDASQSNGHAGLLDLDHLATAGGLEGALEHDAERALATVDARIAERVFRTLTDTDGSNRRVRRPGRLLDIAAAAGASEAEVRAVVEAFRGDARNFLIVRDDGQAGNPRIDISHESLIRQWPRLTKWVDAERSARDVFVQLVRSARECECQRRELMRGLELANRGKEWDDVGATAEWAALYTRATDDYDVAERFVAKSREAEAVEAERQVRLADAELQKEEIQARAAGERRRQRRNIGIAVGVAALALALFSSGMWLKARHALTRADRLVLLSAIRDLSTTDPTMAGALVGELIGTEGLSWSDIEAFGKIADAAVAMSVERDVVSVAASEVGSRFAMLRTDGTVLLFPSVDSTVEVASGAHSGKLLMLDSAGTTAAVTDTAGAIWIVDLTRRRPPHVLDGATRGRAVPVLAKNGGSVLAACDSITACVWSTSGERTPTHRLNADSACNILSLDLSADGSRALVGCESGWVSWSRLTPPHGQVSGRFKGGLGGVASVRFSRDGTEAAGATYGGVVFVWPVAAPESVHVLSQHQPWNSVRLYDGPHGTIVIAAGDGGVRAWTTGIIDPNVEHDGAVVDARVSPDGLSAVSASEGGTARVWPLVGPRTSRVLRGHDGGLQDALFTADGKFVITVARDTSARLWSMEHDAEPFVWEAGSDRVWRAVLSKSGTWLAAVLGRVRDRMPNFAQTALHIDRVAGTFTRDAASDSAGPDSLTAGVSAEDVRFVGDTMHLLLATPDSLLLYRRRPDGMDSRIGAVVNPVSNGMTVLNGNGTTIGLLDNGAASVWRAGDTTVTEEVLPENGGREGRTLYVSNNGSRVLTVPYYYFAAPRLWRGSDGKAIDTLPHSGATLFAFSERDDYLLSAQPDLQLRAYPLAGGKPLTLHGACCVLASLAYNRTGDMVVAGDERGGVNVWAPTLRPGLLRLSADAGTVSSTEFSPDGKRVVAGYLDGSVRIWTIDPALLMQRIRSYTQACVPASMRIERLRESADDAKKRFEACQQKFHGKHAHAK